VVAEHTVDVNAKTWSMGQKWIEPGDPPIVLSGTGPRGWDREDGDDGDATDGLGRMESPMTLANLLPSALWGGPSR